jgi:hypothetical protein
VDEERESLLPIDDDDGNSLAIAALELLVARNVDFLEVERNLGADGLDHAQRALTEVAPLRRVKGQLVPRPATVSGLWPAASPCQASSSVAHVLTGTRAPCVLA